MGPLAWILFGALAGWAAGLISGNSKRQGCIFNIIIGIVGAFLGGFLMQIVTGAPFDFGFNLRSFVVAVIGAVILLALAGMARRNK